MTCNKYLHPVKYIHFGGYRIQAYIVRFFLEIMYDLEGICRPQSKGVFRLQKIPVIIPCAKTDTVQPVVEDQARYQNKIEAFRLYQFAVLWLQYPETVFRERNVFFIFTGFKMVVRHENGQKNTLAFEERLLQDALEVGLGPESSITQNVLGSLVLGHF